MKSMTQRGLHFRQQIMCLKRDFFLINENTQPITYIDVMYTLGTETKSNQDGYIEGHKTCPMSIKNGIKFSRL